MQQISASKLEFSALYGHFCILCCLLHGPLCSFCLSMFVWLNIHPIFGNWNVKYTIYNICQLLSTELNTLFSPEWFHYKWSTCISTDVKTTFGSDFERNVRAKLQIWFMCLNQKWVRWWGRKQWETQIQCWVSHVKIVIYSTLLVTV